MANVKKSKNQLRREKLKQKKQEVEGTTPQINKNESEPPKVQLESKPEKQIQNESFTDTASNGKIFETEVDKLLETEEFSQFKHVFDKFHTETIIEESTSKGDIMGDDDEEEDGNHDLDSDDETQYSKHSEPKVSKKKLRKLQKIPLSELKTYSKHPELVQWYDVDAADPKLVVELKSHKNFIPVPIHWQFKRDYLSGRRGFEKKPFSLPKYISETGITDMRDTTKEDEKSLKQISREKVQPKMNRLDMDYQRLYDAFFKFQTKPRLYAYGEVYFEGKEIEDEVDYKKYKPGVISDELRNALGIPVGVTPPWVLKMQSVGPPPSYPGLKIPGFNIGLEEAESGLVGVESGNNDVEDEEPFGKLLEYESSSEEEEEEEAEEEEEQSEGEENEDEDEGPVMLTEQEVISYNQPPEPESQQEQPLSVEPEAPNYEPSDGEDVPLAEVETTSKPEQEDISPKKLYEILKEKVISDSGFLSSGRTYQVPSSNTNKRKSEEAEHSTKRSKTESTTAQSKKPVYNEGDHDDEDDDDEDEDEESTGKFRF